MTDLDEIVEDVQKIVDDAVAEMEREIGRELEIDEYDALVDDILSELDAHKFSSTQFDIGGKLKQVILAMGRAIPDEELAEDGREDFPHVTLKYGLHTNDADEVAQVVSDFGPVTIKLGKTFIFPAKEPDVQRGGSDFDVVNISVDSDDLHALNRLICEHLEYTDTHPKYVPHVCIAYVKPGIGKKYVGDDTFDGETITFKTLQFSDKMHIKTPIQLEQPSLFDETPKRYAFNPNEPRDASGEWTSGGASSKQTAQEQHAQGHAKEQAKSRYKITKQKIDEGAVRTAAKLGLKGLEKAEDFLDFYGVQPEQQIDDINVWYEGPPQQPRVCFTAVGPWGRADRSIERNEKGELEITNRWIEMKKPGSGMATKMLVGQVRNAIDAGVVRIKCDAAGNAANERILALEAKKRGVRNDALIGYRQWPKHGFDGMLPNAADVPNWYARFPKEYRSAKTVLDLFSIPGGQEWWRENGIDFDASFDLVEGSRSRKVLTTYVMSKMTKLYGAGAKPIKFQRDASNLRGDKIP